MTEGFYDASDTLARLVATNHVMCPECGGPTLGPYHEPKTNEYFKGHYCEDCGINWVWRQSDEPDRQGFVRLI